MLDRTEVLVVGAGPSGLAAGAELRRRGLEPLLVDSATAIGDSWRGHYDRLRLHTVRWLSALPGMPIPRSAGKWVPRDEFIRYLDTYAKRHRLQVRLATEVTKLDREGDRWSAETKDGSILADHVVIATGYNRRPKMPSWPGAEGFMGELLHSSEYRNPEPYRGEHVLVVGTGNSGAEIAVDLVEGGAREVTVSVRTPPTIMRRDIKGFPSQVTGLVMRRLPPKVVDRLARRVSRLAVGDLTPYGLPPPPRGLYTRMKEDDVVPILDVGLVDLVKSRKVRIVAAVERFEDGEVVLADGNRLRPDAVIAATGFQRALEPILGHLGVLGAHGRPLVRSDRTHPNAPNLYFIGYSNSLGGNLHEVGIEAKRIARAVERRRRPQLQRAG